MAREITITADDVGRIAAEMVGNGERPTIRAIRERHGSGSLSTISRLLTDWQSGRRPAPSVADVAVPEALVSAIRSFAADLAANESGRLEGELLEAKRISKELATDNDLLTTRLDTLTDEIEALKLNHARDLATAEERCAGLAARLADAQAMVDKLIARAAAPKPAPKPVAAKKAAKADQPSL